MTEHPMPGTEREEVVAAAFSELAQTLIGDYDIIHYLHTLADLRTSRSPGCRSPSTCRAKSPTSSAPPPWSPPSAPRSTRGCPYDAARAPVVRRTPLPP
ncbi:hypothetical protein [Streptomyces sp. NPDC018045]|uniref:hypothetical protein n=1 Tax=Streptomyces sp. NPDC018045 TaxID=3365037 RepID=UPI0037B6700A